MCPGCFAAERERDLRASAVFHKDTLVCLERLKLIKIQQGAFSTLAKLLFLVCFVFLQVLSIFIFRFSVIKTTR